ncbi:MAG: hypothetical protein JWR26_1335 [Pedosphaera sp.]|nr:hypothetical protein [Pedosphaera sp.]
MIARKSNPTENTPNKELVLTRIFEAPRDLVFKAWIDPRHFAQWWGPGKFTNPVCELDARPGGAIRVVMRGPNGVGYPMGGVFHEIIEPERLAFTTTAFFDEAGKPRLRVLNTVTFEEMNGKTKLTLIAKVVESTPELAAPIAGMKEGWTQSLERLDVEVAKISG